MRRTRVGVLVAAVASAVMAGCGTAPSSTPPANVGNPPPPPAPTQAVGADGMPISSLCDLLSDADFTELTGQAAQKPAAGDATATSASCDYGSGMSLDVQVRGTVDDAAIAYKSALASGGFAAVKTKDAIAGVDESSYGTAAGSGVMNLRRVKLVVSITVPGADNEVKLIQLAGRVLSRANVLGT